MNSNLYALNISITGNLFSVLYHNQKAVLELQEFFKTISNGLKEGVGRVTNASELNSNHLLAVFLPVNQCWNRATLLQIVSNVNIIVRLIDRGEVITTNLNNIRLLDVYFEKCSNEQVHALNHLPALEGFLYGVISINPWNDETKGNFLNLLRSPNTVQIVHNIQNKRFVTVMVGNNIDIRDILITNNLAEKVEDEELVSYFKVLVNNEQANSELKINVRPNIAPLQGPPPVLPPESSSYNHLSPALHTINNSEMRVNGSSHELLAHPKIQSFAEQNRVLSNVKLPPFKNSHIHYNSHKYNQYQPQANILTMAPTASPPRIVPSVQHVSSPTQFTYETLIVGEVLEAYVSMIIDGPSLFVIQLKRNETMLSQLMQHINDRLDTLEPNTDVLVPGSICLGRSADSTLCRALVSYVEKSGVILYFVDFGHKESVKFNNIYRMPPEFMRPKAMAIRVSLARLNKTLFSAKSLQLFANCTLNKAVLIKVVEPEESCLNYVELFLFENDKNINVRDKIIPTFPRYGEISPPPRGTQFQVLVSHVESLSKFFVRYESHEDGLNRITERLTDYCTTAGADANLLITDLVENMPVCCLNRHDKGWYRCSILNADNDPEDIKVFYVDYGITESVSIESLLKIREEYVVNFRSQALQCCLEGNLDEFSDEESISFFSEFVYNKVFTIEVTNILPNNVLLVQLFNENGDNIMDEFRSLITNAFQELTTTTTVAEDASPVSRIIDDEAEWVANVAQKCDVLPHQETVTPLRQQQRNTDQRKSSYGSKYDSDKESSKSYGKREGSSDSARGSNRYHNSPKDGFDGSSKGYDYKKPSDDNASKSFGRRGGDDGGRNDEDNFSRRGKRSNSDLNNWEQTPDGTWGHCDRNNVRKSPSDYENRFKNNDEGRTRNSRNNRNDWSNKQCTENGPVNQLSERGGDKPAEPERKQWNKRYDEKTEDRFGNRSDTNDRFGNKSDTNDRFGNRSNDRFSSRNDSKDSSYGRDSNDRFRNNDSKDSSYGRDSNDRFRSRNDSNDRFSNNDRFKNRNDNNRYRSNDRSDNRNDSNDSGSRNKKPYVKREFNDRGGSFRNQYTPSVPELQDGFAKTGEYVLPEYTIGSTANVIISWFVNPESFFSQVVNPEFRVLMESMQEFYIKIKPSDNIEVGDRVVARYPTDRVIYRAIVQAVNFSDVTVKFVDYGNVGTCKKNSVWTINPDHCTMPIQAIHCGLHDITPPDGSDVWDVSKAADWSNYFLKDSYALSIIESSVDDTNEMFYKITLHDENNESVSDQLVNGGLALKPIIVQTSVELPVDMPLLVGQMIPVHVSHVVSSNKFFVHIEPDKADKIQTLIESAIAETEMVNIPPEQLTKGVFCLVRYVDENPWYRARILSFDSVGNTVNIVYVDFGDEDTAVAVERIYFLPDQLIQYSSQAVECSLYGVSELMSEELEENFEKLVYQNDFTARIDEIADYRCIVTLFQVDGKHIQLPTSSDETAEPLLPMPVLRHRGTFLVFSVSIENGQLQAFIQHTSDTTELQSTQDNLFTVYDTSEAPTEKDSIQIGTICAAKSIFYDTWYRAKVISIDDTGYVVYYVDYGGIPETLQLENLRLLDTKHCYPPEFSLKVSVGISVPEDCDLDAVCNSVCGREYTAELDKYENAWFADMTDSDGKNFADICVEQGFGSKNDIVIEKTMKIRLREWSDDEKLKITNYVSPNEFWIQLDKDGERISKIQNYIQKISDNIPSIVGGYSTEKYFAALNPKDQLWYRCFYENEETIRSIDFGFTISDIVGGIKNLPSFITCETPFAIMCNLDLESKNENEGGGEWDPETHNYFEGSLVIGNILLPQPLNRAIIDLNINDRNIRNLLFEMNLCKKKSHEISISHFNSFDEFYIQMFCNDLIYFSDKIQMYENSLPIIPKIGNLVAAKWIVDGLWYRAYVKSINDVDSSSITYKVQFVDYGNTADCTEFRCLPKDIKETPYFAIECNLQTKEKNLQKFEHSFLEFLNNSIDARFKINFAKFIPNISVTMTYSGEDIIKFLKRQQNIGKLEFGIDMNVILTYVDSPKSFYVQKSDTDLTEIEQTLSTVENTEPLSDVKEHQLVAAIFADDGLWYRGKIKKILPENQYDVFFIDYGNSSITGHLRELPTNIKIIPPMAYHCSLFVPPGLSEWPAEAKSKLVSSCSEAQEFSMFVVEGGNPNIVSLLDNGVDFTEGLATLSDDLNHLLCPSKVDYPTKEVLVTHIESLDDFWIQYKTPQVEEMMNELRNFDHFDDYDISSAKVGDIVAANFVDDSSWYRAQILEKYDENNTAVKVVFIDYGNTALASDLKSLPDDLINLPPLAEKCKLYLPSTVPEWTENSLENFIEIVNDVNNVISCCNIQSDDSLTVKLTCNEEDLSLKILELNIKDKDIVPETSVMDQELELEKSELKEDLIEEDIVPKMSEFDPELEFEKSELKEDLVSLEPEIAVQDTEKFEDKCCEVDMADCQISKSTKEREDVSEIFVEEFSTAKNSKISTEKIANFSETVQDIRSQTNNFEIGFSEPDESNLSKNLLEKIPNEEFSPEKHSELSTENPEKIADFSETEKIETEFSECDESNPLDRTIIEEDDGKNITEISKSQFEKIENFELDDIKKYEFVENCEVKVSYYRDPEYFYIQRADLDNELKEIQNSLLNAESFEKISGKIDVNSVVAVLCSNNLWHRGKVIENNENDSIDVICIDFGSRLSVSINDLRKLPENLKKIPPLAIKCRIPFISKVSPYDPKSFENPVNWPVELSNNFKEFICDSVMKLMIISKNASPMVINLINEKMDAITAIILLAKEDAIKEDEDECEISEFLDQTLDLLIGDATDQDSSYESAVTSFSRKTEDFSEDDNEDSTA